MSFSFPLHPKCRVRRWPAWVLAIGFVATPFGAIAADLSFEDALRLATERAPMLDARQSRIEAAREDAVRAAELPDPQLMVGINNFPVTGADAFDVRAVS